jgi:WD40 repeat protein
MKIWDLRRGHILYTLYGHESQTTAGAFSPAGNYFCTGGKDSQILCWKSNLGQQVECLPDLLKTKIDTEYFKTTDDKSKLPKGAGTSYANQKENKSMNKLTTASAVKRSVASPLKSKVIPAREAQDMTVSIVV